MPAPLMFEQTGGTTSPHARRPWLRWLGTAGWVLVATASAVASFVAVSAGGASATAVRVLRSTQGSAGPASSGGRPAGRIKAGDSKTNCITGGPQVLAQDLQWTGVNFNCVETYTDQDPAWINWVSPWITGPSQPFVAWVAADPTHHQLIDTQNLIPDSEATNPNWTAECAAGDYNTYASQFATNMVAAGLGYTVIRLGHEMNGNWYNDSLGTTQAQWTQWAQCFAQEVTAMRAVHGAHFLFDWNVNANYRDIPLADIYPGNAYVDIIGIDQYDGTGVTLPAPGPTRFAALAAQPEGLDTVEAFAAANGKPLSIPEWGTTTGGPNAGGDDPYYVQGMAAFIAHHDVAYQSYFNANVDGILPLDPSVAPRTVAAYTASVGLGQAGSTAGVVSSLADSTPLAVVPEATKAILLPTSGVILAGGTVVFSRRRRRHRSSRSQLRLGRRGAHSSSRPRRLHRRRP